MSICVAVIDDDVSFREFMAALLDSEGYDGLLLASGEGAVDALKEAQAAALIVDLHLRAACRLGGLALLAQLAQDETLRSLPTLVCSADAPALRAHAAQFAAWGTSTLDKPFELVVLLDWLREAVAERLGTVAPILAS